MTKCLILPLCLLGFIACTIDANGPNGAEDNPLKNESGFCNAWAKAACNAKVIMRCNRPSADVCIEHQSAFCESIVPAGYSSKNAQSCIDAVKKAYSDAELIGAELNLVLRMEGECSHLSAGGAAKGDACTAATDCDTVHGYDCVIKAGDDTGACEIPQIQGVGDACDEPQMVCDSGTYCAELADGGGSICANSNKQMGKACKTDPECVPGYLCMVADGDTDTTCQPKLALSATCTGDAQCGSGFRFTAGTPEPYCATDLLVASGTPLCDNL